MPRRGPPAPSVNSLGIRRFGVVKTRPAPETERAPCRVQRRPQACNEPVDYFLPAIARFAAARYRRFTSTQLMFRMKASRYALRSLP